MTTSPRPSSTASSNEGASSDSTGHPYEPSTSLPTNSPTAATLKPNRPEFPEKRRQSFRNAQVFSSAQGHRPSALHGRGREAIPTQADHHRVGQPQHPLGSTVGGIQPPAWRPLPLRVHAAARVVGQPG